MGNHPFEHLKEKHPGRKRAIAFGHGNKTTGGARTTAFATGGSVKAPAPTASHADLKAAGGKAAGRLDKLARGGKARGKKGGHHTHVNIMVPPNGGDPNAGALPPSPLGAAPPAPSMAPPPGGPMLGGAPGAPPPLGAPPMPGMKRGGGTSGLSKKANIDKWSARASSNTKYAKGGKVPVDAGAGSGEGRLDKIKAYGKRARR